MRKTTPEEAVSILSHGLRDAGENKGPLFPSILRTPLVLGSLDGLEGDRAVLIDSLVPGPLNDTYALASIRPPLPPNWDSIGAIVDRVAMRGRHVGHPLWAEAPLPLAVNVYGLKRLEALSAEILEDADLHPIAIGLLTLPKSTVES